jgi:hypothetical protein
VYELDKVVGPPTGWAPAVEAGDREHPGVSANGLGSGWKVTWAAKAGSALGQPPLVEPPPVSDLVELCNVTPATPSISCRRTRVCATSDWVVAQPATVIVGTVPGGVAEAAVDEAAAPGALVAEAAFAGVAEGVDRALDRHQRGGVGQHATEFVQGVRPVEGSPTSCETACRRCSRIATAGVRASCWARA